MIWRTADSGIEVSFQCLHERTLSGDVWFPIDTLDGMYCLLLNLLRMTQRSSNPRTQKLNIKRRRTLLYIRRALRHHSGRKLPLDVVKGYRANKCHATLKGYTIIG